MISEYPAHLDDTLFGNVTGHLAPGTMFILTGLWWLYHVVCDIVNAQSKHLEDAQPYISRVWYGPRAATRSRYAQLKALCEPLIKIGLGLVGILMELTGAHWTLFNEKGDFENESMNNFSHATMFSFFMLAGAVDIMLHCGILRSRHLTKLGHMMMALAFFVEGFLFYFHLDGRSTLDSHSHCIIYVVCFGTSIVFLAEAIWLECGMLGLLRCFLVILQGSWFYQIAFALYGPRRWSEKSHSAAMFVPIAFAWHCIVLIVFCIGAIILADKCRRPSRYCKSDCEAVSMEHLLGSEDDDNEQDKSDLHSPTSF